MRFSSGQPKPWTDNRQKAKKIQEQQGHEAWPKQEPSYDDDLTAIKSVREQYKVSPPHSAEVSSGEEEEEVDSDLSSNSGEDDGDGALTLLGDIKTTGGEGGNNNSKKRGDSVGLSGAIKKAQQRRERIHRFRKLHRIHPSGSDLPDPLGAWAALKDAYGFSDDMVNKISSRFPGGPTPVQMQAIPAMLNRREVLVCAPTGSGKTAAYLIPLLHLLGSHRKKGCRAIIVAPTRELALQIHREAQVFADGLGLRVLVLDSVGHKKSQATLEKLSKYDIVISTPNRLVYLLKDQAEADEQAEDNICHTAALKCVEWLVVDESDKLFEAGPKGFRDQLAAIYRACDKVNICRAMFSATLAVEVEEWCKLNLNSVISITVGARNTATKSVDQKLVYVGSEKGKLLALRQLIAEGVKPPVLVFVQSKDRAQDLLKELNMLGLQADAIHSDRSQLQRDNAVKSFRARRTWVLICTELMGRGIDFKGVNLVLNYDFPPSTVSYIHRIGRTGRAGRSGQAVTFFTDQDKTLLRSIATIVRDSGGSVPEYMLQLKKASRQEKRKLARQAVDREDIHQESKYDRAKRIRKEEMIAGSKRRKLKAEAKDKMKEEEVKGSKDKTTSVDKKRSSQKRTSRKKGKAKVP